MKSSVSVTLIVPCYNEEINLRKGVLDRVGNFTKDDHHFHEVVIVDDGSHDSSVDIIKTYVKKFPKMRLIENQHQGKAIAVITGITHSKADYVIFTDMDLATPMDETKKLIARFEDGETVVIGSRASKREGAPITRRIQSRGLVFVRNILIGLPGIKDTQCGCKGFKRDVAMQIIDKMIIFTKNRHVTGASVSAAFDLEFLFIARKLGHKIVEVPVEWHHAETKRVSLWKDSLETISDLMSMRLHELKGDYR
jgi:glycosyltransferase involved in cell wall biosynthesis